MLKYAFLLPRNCPILESTVQAAPSFSYPHTQMVQSSEQETSCRRPLNLTHLKLVTLHSWEMSTASRKQYILSNCLTFLWNFITSLFYVILHSRMYPSFDADPTKYSLYETGAITNFVIAFSCPLS